MQVGQPDQVYLVMKGRVNCVAEKNGVFKTFIQQSYFGDVETLQRVPRIFSTKAAIECSLLVISSQKLEAALSRFSDLKSLLLSRAVERLMGIELALARFQCFNGITAKDTFWDKKSDPSEVHTLLTRWLEIVQKKSQSEPSSPE